MLPASPSAAPPATGLAAYHRATRTATYGFLSALPLLALYEGLIVVTNAGRVRPVRIGAELWIKEALAWLGATGHLALGGAVLLVGAAVLWAERGRSVPLRAGYFAGLVAESLAYAVVVAAGVSLVVGVVVGAAVAGGPALGAWAAPGAPRAGELGLELALSLGAGLYEELVFRVLLVGGLFAGLRALRQGRTAAYLAAAVVGAAVFSAVHHLGPLGDPFTVRVFLYRLVFGLALNALYLARGFGVAAWTHALYDVLVVTGLL